MGGATERATGAIEEVGRLDAPDNDLANVASTALRPTRSAAKPIRNALHWTWLGHPLHPSLVALPIDGSTIAFALGAAETLELGRDPHSGNA